MSTESDKGWLSIHRADQSFGAKRAAEQILNLDRETAAALSAEFRSVSGFKMPSWHSRRIAKETL